MLAPIWPIPTTATRSFMRPLLRARSDLAGGRRPPATTGREPISSATAPRRAPPRGPRHGSTARWPGSDRRWSGTAFGCPLHSDSEGRRLGPWARPLPPAQLHHAGGAEAGSGQHHLPVSALGDAVRPGAVRRRAAGVAGDGAGLPAGDI